MTDHFRALVLDEAEDRTTFAEFRDLTLADLPAHGVLVAVEYSTLNFKDGLAVSGRQRIARRPPLIAGADLAGTVLESDDPAWSPGDRVVVNGWGLTETESGGYTPFQRVKPEWLVRLPEGVSTRDAMAIGTAGFTSALALDRLADAGVTGGELVITGAAGGLGSIAVALAARAGFVVTAATGRPETHDYLRELGASAFIARDELAAAGRPLATERWDGGIDSVGGSTLVTVLSETRRAGAVASCGLAQSAQLPGATVLPFILRGVSLLGVDSVEAPHAARERAWRRLDEDLDRGLLGMLSRVEPLSDVPRLAHEILDGSVRGRIVVDVNA